MYPSDKHTLQRLVGWGPKERPMARRPDATKQDHWLNSSVAGNVRKPPFVRFVSATVSARPVSFLGGACCVNAA